MKRFYRQRKNAVKKSNSKSKKKSRVVTERQDDPGYSVEEKILRLFDMNMAYGPCLGITRLERWERAQKLGLNPPQKIQSLLKIDKVQLECLWYKRM
ncbi:DNA-polymerase delta, subunit 4 [Sesbania bispinosa]|nr:DNA-polymerase delta, subunit 4 [Sesbania bispinosa]